MSEMKVANVKRINAGVGGTEPYQKSYHITSNATNTVDTVDLLVSSIVICVTGAGTAWSIVVKDKEATAKTLYSATAALGTTVLNFQEPVLMTSGVDIVTSGTAAGTADVFVHFWK